MLRTNMGLFKQVFNVLLLLLFLRFKRRRQKKVLLVAEYGKSGGTRTYLIYLLQFLHSQGYDVSVLSNDQDEDQEIVQTLKKLNFQSIPVKFDFWCINFAQIPLGLSKTQLIRQQLNELKFWCGLQIQNRFSSFIFSVSYPEKYLYTFLMPVPITYILHTAPYSKVDKIKRLLLRGCLNAEKRILTVSRFAEDAIVHYWLENKRSKYVGFIYNYYRQRYIGKVNMQAQSVKRVLTIGSVENYKNPMFFLETAKAIIKNNDKEIIEFIWAGDGSQLNACREASRNYPQISFIGNVTNVEQLYTEATLYFQPSLMESHGIATLGAMYHRLPCVVSQHGGLKESVIDGKTGFVIPVSDIEASVEKIDLLLRDKFLCKEMGDFGFRIFEKRFTKDIWYKNMKLYFNY
jgi:glycosyltransferase involved in cell wall biosynthesis